MNPVLPDIGSEPVTLRRLLRTLMAPLVWLAGDPVVGPEQPVPAALDRVNVPSAR